MNKEGRPKVVCHMMQTIDGRIASGIPGVEIFDDFFGIYVAMEKHFPFKAYMCGRRTMEMFAESIDTPLPESKQPFDETDFVAENESQTFMITVDTRGVLRWKDNYVSLSGQTSKFHLITIVTRATPVGYLAYLRDLGISYVFAGEEDVDFEEALVTIKEKFGIENILLEGGGSLNGSMLAADVVDDVSLLILPLVLNKTSAPSLFDHEDTPELDLKEFELKKTEIADKGTVWIHYQRSSPNS